MINFTNLKTELSELNAYEAIIMLIQDFQLSHAWVTFTGTGQRYSIKQLSKDKKNRRLYKLTPVEKFGPIEFWGGPPKNRQYHRGTLLTLLCDAILYIHATRGGYVELIYGTCNS